jgi:outer membrane biosynthesis protein TonB
VKTWAFVSTALVALSAFAQSGSYRFSTGNPYPTVISRVEPEYTERAKNAGLEGFAVIAVTIDENGLPQDPMFIQFHRGAEQIQDPLGLDRAAIAALKHWRFRPATKEGKPISLRATISVQFRLPK